MSKYIKNVNTYLLHMKIKQNFISMKTGIEPSKLSRILKENQDITSNDMERIACALGKDIEYFLSDNFSIKKTDEDFGIKIAFYAGEPKEEQEKFALKLIDLIENVDEVLGAKGRLFMAIGE